MASAGRATRIAPAFTHLLPLLRALKVHLDRRPALRALTRLIRVYRLRLGERHVELVNLVLGMPATGTLDAHPHDYGDLVIHGNSAAAGRPPAPQLCGRTRAGDEFRSVVRERVTLHSLIAVC